MLAVFTQQVVQTLKVRTLILFHNSGLHVTNSLVHLLAPDLLHKLHYYMH
jgi:hypothetical protein